MSGRSTKASRGIWTGATSMVLHGAALVAVIILPLFFSGPPPEAAAVRAFFVTPVVLAPPPPPPAPARVLAAGPRRAPSAAATPDRLVAPLEVPTAIVPEDVLALGVDGGVAEGGVEGGVPGGVVGGVIGGLPAAPPPPPVRPLRVGGSIQEPRKLKHVPPVYPDLARSSRLEGIVVLECLIDTRGRVAEVKVLRGLPLLDEAAVEAVRQWVYTQTLMNGEPVPVIMTVTVTFALRNQPLL